MVNLFQMGIHGTKKPFNTVLDGNRASIDFTSRETPPEGSKWSMGLVCIPKTEYKSICEVCDGTNINVELLEL